MVLYLWESYLGVFGIWVCESVSTPICIIPNLIKWNLSVVAHGCRLLPNHVNLDVLCPFSFELIFFIPINCLENFLKPKLFSQSILITFELPLFYNNINIGIKIKMGYYPLNRLCEVPNTFITRNWTSESKNFGLRLWFTLIN